MRQPGFLRRTFSPALLLGLGLCLSAPGPAVAETVVSLREGSRPLFSFIVPDFWTLKNGGVRAITGPGDETPRYVPQVLALTPTVEPTVWIGFFSPPGIETISQGRDYMRDIAQYLAFEPRPNPPRPARVGGYQAQILSGTGRRYGREIQYSVAVVDLPGDRIAIAAAVVEVGSDPAFYDEVNRIIGSLRAGR